MSKEETVTSNEKYKELYDYSLMVYKLQHDVYESMSAKASRYFTALTILVTGYGFLVKEMFSNTNKDNISGLEWFFVVYTVILLIIAFYIYFRLLQVIKLEQIVNCPCTDEILEFYDKNTLINIYYTMSKGIKIAVAGNEIVINIKAKLLGIAYNYFIVFGTLLLIFFVFYVINKVC